MGAGLETIFDIGLEKEQNQENKCCSVSDGKYLLELDAHELDLIYDALGLLKEHPSWTNEKDKIEDLKSKVNVDILSL